MLSIKQQETKYCNQCLFKHITYTHTCNQFYLQRLNSLINRDSWINLTDILNKYLRYPIPKTYKYFHHFAHIRVKYCSTAQAVASTVVVSQSNIRVSPSNIGVSQSNITAQDLTNARGGIPNSQSTIATSTTGWHYNEEVVVWVLRKNNMLRA